ncbi:MAG: cell division protein FtsZ [Desulfohalobiaceae bacterium]|nr:cell division protein FtsZ [Desulfohalobiaceae bacterium]
MEYMEIQPEGQAQIKVVGIGGGGGNAINNMIHSSLEGVSFIAANTDVQALKNSAAEYKIQLGEQLTKGLGAGANPDTGREAAQESSDTIREMLAESDMVFVTAGMGGGTGTGAAPIIAEIAREQGALTVGVVTKPFYFEGKQRNSLAEKGIKALRESVDSIITIPNDRLLSLASKKATFLEMLQKADEVLYYAVKGISDLIMVPGLINLDFADVKAVMSGMGLALMGTGIAQGEGRAREAAMKAITSPLLEDVSIDGANGVLMNITSGQDLTVEEVHEAASAIYESAREDAQIYFGTVFDDNAAEEMRITVIATGIDNQAEQTREQTRTERESRMSLVQNKAAVGEERESTRRTPPADSPEDREIPTYVRKGSGVSREEGQFTRPEEQKQEPEEFVFDEDDREIPSFIRKQAD